MVFSTNELLKMGSKEITKRIRNELKETFKNCKFSVTKQEYSGGWSLHVHLMEAKGVKIIKDFEEIPEIALLKAEARKYTREQIKEMQKEKYHQLGSVNYNYDSNDWTGGVFLTEQGHNIFKKITEIASKYNWDNSDVMTDYFDVNFYLHLYIGKWDKPFIQN